MKVVDLLMEVVGSCWWRKWWYGSVVMIMRVKMVVMEREV